MEILCIYVMCDVLSKIWSQLCTLNINQMNNIALYVATVKVTVINTRTGYAETS